MKRTMSNPITSPCGCGNGNQSVKAVCGDFNTDTDTPDLGQCSPYREKRDCGAPVKPQNPCDDSDAYAESRPNEHPPFVIITKLHDENCDPILDENGAPILTAV